MEEFIRNWKEAREQEIRDLQSQYNHTGNNSRMKAIKDEIRKIKLSLKPENLVKVGIVWQSLQPPQVSHNESNFSFPTLPPQVNSTLLGDVQWEQKVAAQRERNAAAQRERNAVAAAEAAQRERNVTVRAQRNNQAARNAQSISWLHRIGNRFARTLNPMGNRLARRLNPTPGIGIGTRIENSLARTFNPTPGIGIGTRIENTVARVVNPIPGINPVNYLESAIAEKFNPVAQDVEQQVTNMISDQKKRIDSTLASINTQIAKTTNQQKKNILLALKGLLEKMSSLNAKLAEYLERYDFIPVWIIFTISNLSYLLTLVLMFYFFLGLGQSVVLALIVMRIGHTLFGQKSTVVKQTLEATGVAPAARAMYNISVGEAHRSAAQVAEEERKEEEVPIEEEAEEVAQVVDTFQREAPDLQARHRVWIRHARRGLPAATGAAQAAQEAYQQAKAAGQSDDEADAAADTAGQEAAERISPQVIKQDTQNEEIGGLIGAIGGGIVALFEACGIGRTRRPPITAEENARRGANDWAKIEPLLDDPFMSHERIRVRALSDAEMLGEIETYLEANSNSINTRGIIVGGKLKNRKMAERKLLAFLSKQRVDSNPRRRTRKAKHNARKSRKHRRN